jgi:hypothetical protein
MPDEVTMRIFPPNVTVFLVEYIRITQVATSKIASQNAQILIQSFYFTAHLVQSA